MTVALQYLIFDRSEPADGVVNYDAACTVSMSRWGAVSGELRAVLSWAWAAAPAGPGPMDEGHDWDMDLQGSSELSTRASLRFDVGSGDLAFGVGGAAVERRTVQLSLSLRADLAAAFEAAGFHDDGAS